MLSKDIRSCLVIEDAPSGIKSGKAAGATVLAVCTSHKREALEGLGADCIVENLGKIHLEVLPNSGFRIRISKDASV